MTNSKIPYVKSARVGNFRLWRKRHAVTTKDDDGNKRTDFEVECIVVASLDGTWQVQIPSSYEMFAVLNAVYYDYATREGEEKANALSVLTMFLSNMMYATVTGNGFFHRALMMVASAYVDPTVLEEGTERHEKLVMEYQTLATAFVDWCKDRPEFLKFDDDQHRDELADQAQAVVDGEK